MTDACNRWSRKTVNESNRFDKHAVAVLPRYYALYVLEQNDLLA